MNEQTIRIFHGAPRGTAVYEIQLDTLIDITQTRVVRLSLGGPDHHHFQLDQNTLKIDEYPRLSGDVDQKYRVDVELTSVDKPDHILAVQKLDILVSVKNTLAPYFVRDNYTAEIFRYSEVGVKILQVEAKDDDEVDYNREVVYSIPQGYKVPVTITKKNGNVLTLQGLRNAPAVILTSITATNVGSPQLSNRTNVTIIVREISGNLPSLLVLIFLLKQNHE